MFCKCISLKNKQQFERKGNNNDNFTLLIEIKSNHTIDPVLLTSIEQHINTLNVVNYDKKVEEKKV